MLPPLASLDDLDDRVDGGIDQGDRKRATALLVDASNLVRAEVGLDWMNGDRSAVADVPDMVVSIVCAVAKRVFLNPDGFTSERVGDWSGSTGTGGALELTGTERRALQRLAGNGGLWTIDTTRDRLDRGLETPPVIIGIPETFMEVDGGGGESFPWSDEVGM